jgi:hypothetical protein
MHSHEEDNGDVLVYRPESYQFPPARGRDGLEPHPDGSFYELRVGRGDAPEKEVPGGWRQQDARSFVVNFASPMNSQPAAADSYILEIVEAGDDVLKVRKRRD